MSHSVAHEPRAVNVQVRGENLGRPFLLSCRTAADENLVSGWGKSLQADNEADLHLEGLGYQVEAFLDWLRSGVTGSRVGRVLVTPSEKETWSDFVLLD